MITPVALWLVTFGTGVPFIFGGLACLAAAFSMRTTIRVDRRDTSAAPSLVQRLFTRISLSLMTNFTAGFMEGSLIALIPLYTLREGFNPAQTGILLSAFMIGHGGSPPFIGMLADRIGLRRVLALVYLLGIAVFLIIVAGTFRMGLAVPLMLAGMSVGALYPLAVGIIGERLPSEDLPRGNAMITAAYGMGSILGPLASFDHYACDCAAKPFYYFCFSLCGRADNNEAPVRAEIIRPGEGISMISGIILASGFSSRMKREKLTLAVEGIPMLERVIRAAMASTLDEVLLVYQKDEIRDLGQKYRLSLVHNSHPEYGQSAAVKAGVKCACPESDGFMFLVGDQPYVSAVTIDRLITAFKKDMNRIVVPVYGSRRGNPVIFPSSAKRELLLLEGDMGGRAVIDIMKNLISVVVIQDEREAMDVDTDEAYDKYERWTCVAVR